MPYHIAKIELEGFRGFRHRKELHFEQGLVILHGPQRSGKSSILNAPVWALIGSEACRREIGPITVRERIDWLERNIHVEACQVAIHLQREDGEQLFIRRGPTRTKYVVQRNGSEIKEPPLQTLRLTLDGLISSVFLPQEVVRAALSVEPTRRRAIFTQLVGLEDLRALEDSFHKASETLQKSAHQIARYIQQIDAAIKGQVALQKVRIQELSAKLRMLGLSAEAVCPEGVPSLVNHCLKALTEFCATYRLEPPRLPEVRTPEDLPGFVHEVRSALSRFESGCPETQRQRELYAKRHAIEGLLAEGQKICNERQRIQTARHTIAEHLGTEEDIKLAIEQSEKALRELKDQIDRAGKYLKMIQEALLYFEALPDGTTEMECPVCRTARVSVAHVRQHLASEMEKAGLEPLRQRRQQIERNLREKQDALNQLAQFTEQEKQLDAKWNDLVNKVTQMYGQPLAPNESLELVLKRMDDAAQAELKQFEGLLEARSRAIRKVQEELERLGQVVQLHCEKRHLQMLDDIPNLPEYRALLELQASAELFLGLLSELQRALKKEIEEAFVAKFADLKEKLNELYRRLVGRKDFPEIWIDTDNWEVRTGAGDRHTALTRVFNVGDMTAVALCLFLASAMRATHEAGFILLDDPIQCLDEEHETHLAEILAELAKERQVVVSCSRSSFLHALQAAGTVTRQVIRLAPWDNNSCRLEA